MKTTGHLILYISETEDFELWRVLSQISPDDRAAFVKNALKKAVVLGKDDRKEPTGRNHPPAYQMDRYVLESPIKEAAVDDVGLDDAALDEIGLDEVAFDEVGFDEVAFDEVRFANAVPDPLPIPKTETGKQLEDSPNNNRSRFQPVQEETNDDALEIDELFQSSEFQNQSAPPGLNFLLTNVIGEEDDEKVIEFIRSSRSAADDTKD